MRRRQFLGLIGAAVALPVAARGQPVGRIGRVGFLGNDLDTHPIAGPGYKVFISELQKLGFTEGRNLLVEYRRVDQGTVKAFTGANELGAAKSDVLVAANGTETAVQAAAAVRPAVPIVMLANNFDPIARGYVASL